MIRFIIKPSHDKPVNDAKLLGHDKLIENLKKFIESSDMITPLSIAIHGDWGSGKTSIMRTLESKLDSNKITTVFFEPWRYENADPPLALISNIIDNLSELTVKKVSTDLIIMASNAISKKFLGLDVDDVLNYVGRNTTAVKNFSKELEKTIKDNIGVKKLVVIIDDLDRCDVENTLLILSVMKLFLDIENCICVAAVDFKRLQQAWRVKYHIGNDSDDGMEYLEKIFQIRIALPLPSPGEIREYLETLTPQMPAELNKLFAYAGPRNPRSIKRILNLVRYRAGLLNSDYNYQSASLWTLLENILSNEEIIHLHGGLKSKGNTIAHFIANFDPGRWDQDYKKIIYSTGIQETRTVDTLLIIFFTHANQYFTSSKIPENELDNNFDKLKILTNEKVV